MIDLLLEERKCDEALQRAQSLADTLPDDPDVAHVLAIVYDVSGDEERALETFEHAAALAINGQSSGRQRQQRTGEKAGDALTEASECFDRGEYDEAFRRIKPVLDTPSASPAAHLLAGRILTAQGDAVQAIYHYELASGHLQSVDEPEVGVASSGNVRRR
jgi:tetratricopeptide (TPR) repeat protein